MPSVRRNGGNLKQKEKMIPLLKCLLCAYIVTAGFLMLLALLLYKFRLSEQVVSIAIIAVYVIATFTAGFFTGKCMEKRRFLWGLGMGTVYFLILALVSVGANGQMTAFDSHFFTTFVLCAAGGTLGGMVS